MNFAGRLSLGGARRNWGSANIIPLFDEKSKNGGSDEKFCGGFSVSWTAVV